MNESCVIYIRDVQRMHENFLFILKTSATSLAVPAFLWSSKYLSSGERSFPEVFAAATSMLAQCQGDDHCYRHQNPHFHKGAS